MTGAGKSVIIADLLAQIGHQFGFRLIVEEGLSHAVLTQKQGYEPVIINPNGYKAIVKEPRWDKAILMIVMGLAQGFEFWATDGTVGRAEVAFRMWQIDHNLQHPERIRSFTAKAWADSDQPAANSSTGG